MAISYFLSSLRFSISVVFSTYFRVLICVVFVRVCPLIRVESLVSFCDLSLDFEQIGGH